MSFGADRRGQAIQVGAVLLFGVLIIVFAIYQSVVVPSQNQQVEFNHNQRVQADMIDVRNAILTAKSTGEDTFASVELGTEFPPRLVGINPGSPTGTLRTTDPRPIVIEEVGTGTDVTDSLCPGSDITTRFVEYQPSYAEYGEAGTIRYENTVLYHDFGERIFRISGQDLVREDTLRVLPVTARFNTGGSQTVAIELKPGKEEETAESDLNVTFPTRLSTETWEDILSGQVAPANIYNTSGPGGRNVTIELSGSVGVTCGPVGFGETPPSGPRGGGIDEINPAAPGDVRLVDETLNGNTVTLAFNNTAGTNNFTAARLPFYQAQGGNPPTEADIGDGTSVSGTLQIGGDWVFFAQADKIRIEGGGAESTLELEFNNNVNPNDWFVIDLRLETGESGLYFVDIQS